MLVDRGPYITTFTGKRFHFLDPRPEEVCIEDIAHHLSLINRFTGASRKPYNDAEHSVRVSQLCETPDMYEGLLHDASEAYLNDVSRPLKHHCGIMDGYIALEHKVQAFLYDLFGVKPRTVSSVPTADRMMSGIEARDLGHPSILVDSEWKDRIDPIREHPLSVVEPWSHERAEREFLIRYYQLTYNNKAREEAKR